MAFNPVYELRRFFILLFFSFFSVESTLHTLTWLLDIEINLERKHSLNVYFLTIWNLKYVSVAFREMDAFTWPCMVVVAPGPLFAINLKFA